MKIRLLESKLTKDGLPFEADKHPHIEGNEVEVTHVLRLPSYLVIIVMWDGGYDAPWNEVHEVYLSAKQQEALNGLGEDQKLHITWARTFKEQDPEEDDYVPEVEVP